MGYAVRFAVRNKETRIDDLNREEIIDFVNYASTERGGGWENHAMPMMWGVCPVCNLDTLFAKNAVSANTCGRLACEIKWKETYEVSKA